VAAERTKFRDRKGNEADVEANLHPLRVFFELGLLSTRIEQTGNHGIKSKF
jgi:hypothetical protein